MSNGDHNLQDDAELDDFLAGRDALSRQLAALAQPEAPKQVNDAIMASIEAQLAQERAAQTVQQVQAVEAAPAAHAAQAGGVTQVATRRPAANMARWRAPAALAASLVGVLLLTLEWQRGDYAQQAQMTAAAPEQKPVASTPQAAEQPAPQPAPPALPTVVAGRGATGGRDRETTSVTAAVSAAAAPSPSGHIAPSPSPARPAPAQPAPHAEPAAKLAPSLLADADKAPEPIIITPPAEQFLRARSAPTANLAAAVPPSVTSGPLAAPISPSPATTLSYSSRSAPSMPPAAPIALPAAPPAPPAPPPAPALATSATPVVAAATAPTLVTVTGSARKAMSPADTARAAEWLHVIDEMLKADLRQDAREEWRKFNLAYPDYPVPEQLAKRIDAIN
ncbi:hypothetical protein [Duganella levis]|uniref:Uncharacterized protein n=1 Tax=Duganella levis TaxID=2692169 RepID=A0ABW9W6X8_9BURK|nr:hypothetical protein [Duganella levis]MYN29738.1 hypothetical protein [Duganella levis]